MDKLKMMSMDRTSENIEKIRAIFPNCVTEVLRDGKEEYAIDFDMLRQELSKEIVEEREERYQMTWPDKKKAILLANTRITKTLRPCREESVDFDNTENLYIEGDNLEVLKLLQETYLGKVKMIYIDPPYNTGNDSFVYNDIYSMDEEEFEKAGGYYDEEGNRVIDVKANSESNGRFHTDWLNMIYPRLKIARDLLSDDGVIFISIDDNEQANLKKVCDEVFGNKNFVAQMIWERAFAPKNDAKYISNSHDYVIMYAKYIENFSIGKLERTEEANARYKNLDNDPRGIWTSDNLTVKTYSEKYDYSIETPSGKFVTPAHGSCWRVSKEKFDELVKDNRIWFGENGDNVPRLKRFLSEVQQGMTPTSILFYKEVGHSQEGRQELKRLFDDKGYFDGPKPIRLLKHLLTISNTQSDEIILDFFSGSATTAHAVMQLNAEDGGNRKFIMVQLPEACDEKSEAYKAGYKNICEIGKERIRRAGKKIKEESPLTTANLDTGFRVLKLDSSNMRDVFYKPEELTQMSMLDTQDNIKPDRSAEDLLFQVMLDMGAPLSAKIEQNTVCGKQVFTVADNYLMACFEDNLAEDVITAIAKQQPLYAVFRDSSFTTDSVAKNVEQIFATYSPDTKLSIL